MESAFNTNPQVRVTCMPGIARSAFGPLNSLVISNGLGPDARGDRHCLDMGPGECPSTDGASRPDF